MLEARHALRQIYANTLQRNIIIDTLDEMKARGLPQAEYDKFLNEAIDIGLIPVAGRSIIGGKIVTEKDILKVEHILEKVDENFDKNRYFYGIG